MTDVNRRLLYKGSGISAIIIVVLYILIIVLYLSSGVPPKGGEAWLKQITGHGAAWRSILGLSVFTDLLYVPVAYSLYILLKEVDKNTMLFGLGFMILFVFLDLAITWPNYSSLFILSRKYSEATNNSERELIIATADYLSGLLSSSLIAVYVILFPAIGILMMSTVMLKGTFSKTTGYLGVITGILGVISVTGAFFISALGNLVVLTSVLTTIWFFFVGYRLLKLTRF